MTVFTYGLVVIWEVLGGGGGGGRRRKRSNTFEHVGNIISSQVLSRIHTVTTNLQPLQSQNEKLLSKQKMSDLRVIKYPNSAKPNIFGRTIAPITIIFERLAKRSVNPYVDIKRLLNNVMNYKVKGVDETSSYPIIVHTTVFPTTENI